MLKKTIIMQANLNCNTATNEAQSLEEKLRNIMNQTNTIDLQAVPLIYTDRKDGVLAGYDIRTDRFDIALEARDRIAGMLSAQRQASENSNEQQKTE